ncbi:MAG: type II toxin-antitoxin system Phd/YefM family antitoxin [Patescibacteria group bacterium]
MKSKNTLSVSEGRKNIFSIIEEVQKPNIYYTLTERGKPKAVILSAEKFEYLVSERSRELSKNVWGALSESERKMWVADKARRNYIAENPQVFPKVFVIRDESKVVYLSSEKDNMELRHKEEELIKAQLYIKLIEKLKYPLYCIEIGRYVRVGGPESKRYVEADIIINDQSGNVNMIFEVGAFSEFEKNLDCAVADLFELSKALSWVKKPKCLVYYSRSSRKIVKEEKIVVVDTSRFNSFQAWKKAGRPGTKEIPPICDNCAVEDD